MSLTAMFDLSCVGVRSGPSRHEAPIVGGREPLICLSVLKRSLVHLIGQRLALTMQRVGVGSRGRRSFPRRPSPGLG